jgi:hypothetical protein
MGDIFSNSSLVIFAALEGNAHSGLGVMRDGQALKTTSLRVKIDTSNMMKEQTFFIRPYHALDLDRREPRPQAPIFDRGWVLQEEIATLRGLIFTETQMYWNCLRADASEIEPTPTDIGLDEDKKRIASEASPGMTLSQLRSFDKQRWWSTRRDLKCYNPRSMVQDG